MSNDTPSLDAASVRDVHTFLREVAAVEQNSQQDNAVYVLKCVQLHEDDEQMQEMLKTRYSPDSTDAAVDYKYSPNRGYEYPSELDMAIFADEVYYVGETASLDRRIREHLVQGGATLTKNFPPVGIERVEWLDSREDARERESELLEELGNMDELPPHISVPYHWKDERHSLTKVQRQDVKEIFPNRDFSEEDMILFSNAVMEARNRDGVLISDADKIREIALERIQELRDQEPEKFIYVGGG